VLKHRELSKFESAIVQYSESGYQNTMVRGYQIIDIIGEEDVIEKYDEVGDDDQWQHLGVVVHQG